MSKYEPLWKYIKEKNLGTYELSFREIKNILGFDIDHSFLTYKKELIEYGYEVAKISMKNSTVIIKKTNQDRSIVWKTIKDVQNVIVMIS